MNEREVAEIRRRFRPDKSNITHVRGCYVNEQREIVAEFNQSLGLMPQEELEKFLSLLKRTLSGTVGKNLIDIEFTTQQVVDSEEHRLLMKLRNSALEDGEAVQTLFQRVIQSVALEGTYLILLANDTYDVPYRAKDGASLEDASEEAYSYILCSVCPVKMTKPALSYYVRENEFHNRKVDWLVGAPELGFLFPAFDDRSTNLYSALYYSRDIQESHEEFVEAVFRREVPMPAAQQQETFRSVLGGTLEDECSLEVVQAVHEQLCEMIEEHKASKVPEPLAISSQVVEGILETCGVSQAHVEAFEQRCQSEFGEGRELSPRNLVDPKHLELSTPDVTIRVNPERGDLVEARVIGGTKYILIRAEEGVEVNGVPIHIS